MMSRLSSLPSSQKKKKKKKRKKKKKKKNIVKVWPPLTKFPGSSHDKSAESMIFLLLNQTFNFILWVSKETFVLGTETKCLNGFIRKYLQFYSILFIWAYDDSWNVASIYFYTLQRCSGVLLLMYTIRTILKKEQIQCSYLFYILIQISRGGSRISGKGVYMYKGVEGSLCWFISSF